jgi:hypothetical protein
MAGMVSPLFAFMVAVLEEYGLLLSHLHADGLLTMSVFQHLYEACVWIIPNVALFRHYFIPRLVNHVVTGDVTFILRDAKEYISVEEAWPVAEWPHKWCFVIFPEELRLRISKQPIELSCLSRFQSASHGPRCS